MKLSIEKALDKVKIEVTTDTKKPPLVLVLAPDQLNMLVQMLQMAGKADRFQFSLEV